MFYAFASDVDLSMLGASLTKAGLELPLKINTPLFFFQSLVDFMFAPACLVNGS